MQFESNCEHEIRDIAKFEEFLASGKPVPSREKHAATLGGYGVTGLIGEGYEDCPAVFFEYNWVDVRQGYFEVYDGAMWANNTQHETLRAAVALLYVAYYQ